MHESLQNNLQYIATVVVIYYNMAGVDFYFKNEVLSWYFLKHFITD